MKAKDYWKLDLAIARSREQFSHDMMLCRLYADDIYPIDFLFDEPSADYWLDEIDFS